MNFSRSTCFPVFCTKREKGYFSCHHYTERKNREKENGVFLGLFHC